jgi:hypothetical protein
MFSANEFSTDPGNIRAGSQLLTSQTVRTALQWQLLSPRRFPQERDTTMTTPSVGVERRIGQRFAFNLPVFLRDVATAVEGPGFTQDLSSRGVFLFTDVALREGTEIELTLKMPSEITLGENMRVRCRGRVLRIVRPADAGWKPAASARASTQSADDRAAETKIGVAVCLKGYEYLPEAEDSSADFRRISALHSPSETQRPATPVPAGPRAAAH